MQRQTITFYNITDFDVAQTLTCGQCFRWKENVDDSFSGVVNGRLYTVRAEGHTVTFSFSAQGDTEQIRDFLSHYFDFDTDYAEIKRLLSRHPVFKSAAAYAPGIHILRQDSWETLCSFIISQNNNIKRIGGIIDRLCETFGNLMPDGSYEFPTAKTLSYLTEEDLAPLRCGFRAKYIIDAAKRVVSGKVSLDTPRILPIEEARAELMKIYGVGPKVADCALLFGFGRTECFPKDVWINRAVAALFPEGLPEYALPYAGIAQQYLFHYARNNPQLFED